MLARTLELITTTIKDVFSIDGRKPHQKSFAQLKAMKVSTGRLAHPVRLTAKISTNEDSAPPTHYFAIRIDTNLFDEKFSTIFRSTATLATKFWSPATTIDGCDFSTTTTFIREKELEQFKFHNLFPKSFVDYGLKGKKSVIFDPTIYLLQNQLIFASIFTFLPKNVQISRLSIYKISKKFNLSKEVLKI
uniref:Uncharacterized protein n=1 Tax=Romanomermis culicivorax TaxID=13658 RepID=A0A915ISX2_ROMCU